MARAKIHQGDVVQWLQRNNTPLDLAFVDPPFNQGKDYRCFNDQQDDATYWEWMTGVLKSLHHATTDGGAVYFMHREKNARAVFAALEDAGWQYQNLIIWKKMTSAVPSRYKYGLSYQIIAYATKGKRARVFNRLRIQPPKPANHKYERKNGLYVTDIWDDIRELTSGYYAGDEPLRNDNGERFHKQQSPLALLARIILSSSKPGDTIFDPFAGTGTTLMAAKQLHRTSIGVEIDAKNVERIEQRLKTIHPSDNIAKLRDTYRHTASLNKIWGKPQPPTPKRRQRRGTDTQPAMHA